VILDHPELRTPGENTRRKEGTGRTGEGHASKSHTWWELSAVSVNFPKDCRLTKKTKRKRGPGCFGEKNPLNVGTYQKNSIVTTIITTKVRPRTTRRNRRRVSWRGGGRSTSPVGKDVKAFDDQVGEQAAIFKNRTERLRNGGTPT